MATARSSSSEAIGEENVMINPRIGTLIHAHTPVGDKCDAAFVQRMNTDGVRSLVLAVPVGSVTPLSWLAHNPRPERAHHSGIAPGQVRPPKSTFHLPAECPAGR